MINKSRLRNPYIIVLAVALLAIGGGVYYYVTHHNSDSSQSLSQNDRPSVNVKKNPEAVVKQGTVQCLTPKDNAPTRDLSCALGLVEDNGTAYALHSSDPTQVGAIPTSQKVEVTGMLAEISSRYTVAGTISIKTIKRL